MENKKVITLNRAVGEAFLDIENIDIKTITLDNGTEFAEFKNLEELINHRPRKN
jgi:IS30 family transposase